MKLIEIKRIIAANIQKPIFLVYGKDIYGLRCVTEAIKEQLLAPEETDMLRVFDSDPAIDEFQSTTQSLPFFSNKNVIQFNDCKLFKAKPSEEGEAEKPSKKKPTDGWDALFETLPEFNKLIIVCRDNIDKRLRIYKSILKIGCVIEVEAPNARSAREYFEDGARQAGYRLENPASLLLQSALENATDISFGMLDNELAKLLLYQGDDRLITALNLEKVFSASFNMSVFKFCDMLSTRKAGTALQLLEKLLASGEPLIKLLSLCARQYRLLTVAKELLTAGCPPREIAGKLKVQPFVADNVIRDCKNYSLAELRAAICAIATLDAGLKNGKANIATAYAVFARILVT